MNLKEEILQQTNRGLEVFYFYMPIDFVPKRNFRNPLYDDRRASCNIYFDPKSETYRMKDFGNEAYSGDCFWFVATILGLDVRTDFKKVLATIVHDLDLKISLEYGRGSDWKSKPLCHRSKRPIEYPPTSAGCPKSFSSEEKKEYLIHERSFTAKELAFWERYGISAEVLEQYHVKSLSRYESVSREGKPFTLSSSPDEPIFCYHLGEFVKIYRPHRNYAFSMAERNWKTMFLGWHNCPLKGIFSSSQEEKKMSFRFPHTTLMPSVSIAKQQRSREG